MPDAPQPCRFIKADGDPKTGDGPPWDLRDFGLDRTGVSMGCLETASRRKAQHVLFPKMLWSSCSLTKHLEVMASALAMGYGQEVGGTSSSS